MNHSLIEALRAWQELLGDANLIATPQQLAAVATATFPTTQRIPAILRPATREQVQECLSIATRYKTPVYPISSGRNWGYGSAVPIVSDCVILDLGRLNRIVDYDDQLGYVTLEPGVTQRQLCDFLQAQGGKFWMDATGASETCSVIGNTMERGFGHSPYGDHFAHVCSFEVVLPDGDCIRTGLERFANARANRVYRWGVGPYVDGLFTQSNLGVVTQMTVWLMPAPEYFQAYFFSVTANQELQGLIDALRPLRLNGTIKSALHIGNAYRVLSSIQQYPWEATGGKTPLSPPVLDALSEQSGLGAWSGSGALYGTRTQVKEARRQIKQAVQGRVTKLHFIDDRLLEFAERWQQPLKWLLQIDVPEMLKLVRPVFNMMKGIPTDQIIASTYWRKQFPPPQDMNPDRDRCGLLWCGLIAPLSGEQAQAMTEIATEILLRHGFEPGMTITLLTERSLENVISIAYDRDVEGEDDRAMACYRELLEKVTQAGFYPYRLGNHSMTSLPASDDYDKFLRTLKVALDPHNILAPGRYVQV